MRPDVVPKQEVIKVVVDQVAQRLLAMAAKEIGHSLAVVVQVHRGEDLVSVYGDITADVVGPAQHGTLRVRFRETFDEERHNFFIDSLFDKDPRTPAFSGFFARGDVRPEKNGLAAHFKTWVVKRDDNRWTPWL